MNGNDLTIPQVVLASENAGGTHTWCTTARVKELLRNNSDYLNQKIDEGCEIYGINTGFGGSADVRSSDVLEIQQTLIKFMKAGFGKKLSSDVVRGVMIIRANCLSRGFSGVRPDIVECLLRMLNEDVVPIVPKRGTISASGDLLPTSYVAAAMMGKTDSNVVYKNSTVMTAREAFNKAGISHVTFQAKEALAVINAASFADSLGAKVLFDALIALLMTQMVTALSVEGLLGKKESFNPTVNQCMPHPGQTEVAANILRFLEGSQFTSDTNGNHRSSCEDNLKQDRYALRTAAQWLGPAVEVLSESIRRITIDLNSTTNNPIIDHRNDDILHGGNFQGTSATVAMDQVRQAIQLCGKLLFAQMSEMLNCKMSHGLTPNLCGSDPSTDFGMKGMDIAMAAYMSELDYLTAPVTNHALSAEMHNQSVNSLAFISARLSNKALKILQMMLANILLANIQAIELRWLEKQTKQQVSYLARDLGITEKAVDQLFGSWYNCIFNPDMSLESIVHTMTKDANSRTDILRNTEEKLHKIYNRLVSGESVSEIGQKLGRGKFCSVYLSLILLPFFDFVKGQRLKAQRLPVLPLIFFAKTSPGVKSSSSIGCL